MNTSRPETVFQQVIRDDSVPKLFESDQYRIAAFADPFPKLPYQAVVVPYRPFDDGEIVLGDMYPFETFAVAAVGFALQRKLQSVCKSGQLALLHTEGYGVPGHGHMLVYQSYERKSGVKLYTGSTLPPASVEQTIAALTLSAKERGNLLQELDKLHHSFGVM